MMSPPETREDSTPLWGYSQRCVCLDEYRGPASGVVVGGEDEVGADSELVEALEQVSALVGLLPLPPHKTTLQTSHLYVATPNMSLGFQPT